MNKILCSNRKAHYEYDIVDTIEAGIVLKGCEIKSLREHNASLDASYAVMQKDELWLINSHIDEYKNSSENFYEPKRERKLLLKKSEIRKFVEQASQKGFTLIPLSFFLSGRIVKVELAVAKGKQTHDKRASIKERELERELRNLE